LNQIHQELAISNYYRAIGCALATGGFRVLFPLALNVWVLCMDVSLSTSPIGSLNQALSHMTVHVADTCTCAAAATGESAGGWLSGTGLISLRPMLGSGFPICRRQHILCLTEWLPAKPTETPFSSRTTKNKTTHLALGMCYVRTMVALRGWPSVGAPVQLCLCYTTTHGSCLV
jgi:hypothetical protein